MTTVCLVYSRYIASKYRHGDLDEFFPYENHLWPPSVSQDGRLRLPSKKSHLLMLMDIAELNVPPSFQAKIFDDAAVVIIFSQQFQQEL